MRYCLFLTSIVRVLTLPRYEPIVSLPKLQQAINHLTDVPTIK